jgi:hypothetical protein
VVHAGIFMTAALVTAVLGWWLGSAVVLDVRSRRESTATERVVRVQSQRTAVPDESIGPEAVAVLDDDPDIELR